MRRLPAARRAGAAPAVRAVRAVLGACALAALAAATLGAFYEWGGPARRGVNELKRGENAAALHSLGEARAEQPTSAAIRYDQAIAFRRLGLADSARTALDDAMRLRGAEAKSAAAYNLGNEALRQSRLEEAVARYRESLRVDPRRVDAKKNLEEAIRRLRRAKPPSAPSGGGGGGSRGPSGSGGGGGGTGAPPPDAPPGEAPRSREPSVGGPIPSRSDAELWLDALESERRSERKKERRGEKQEERVRDW